MLSKAILDSIPQAIRIIRKFVAQSLVGDLTLQQFRVLKLINCGQGLTLIADNLEVSVAAISKTTEALAQKKMILKKSGEDRRTYDIKLTAKGKKTLAAVASYVESRLEKGVELLNKKEKEDLMKGLVVLDSLMKKMKEV